MAVSPAMARWGAAALSFVLIAAIPLAMGVRLRQASGSAATASQDLKLFTTAQVMVLQEDMNLRLFVNAPSESTRERFVSAETSATSALSDVVGSASGSRKSDATRLVVEHTAYRDHADLVTASATAVPSEEVVAAVEAFAVLIQDMNSLVLALSSTTHQRVSDVATAQEALLITTLVTVIVCAGLAVLGAIAALLGRRRWIASQRPPQPPPPDPHVDPLTELPDATAFEEQVRAALIEARQSAGRGVTICAIHLDNLAKVGSMFGADGADQLIIAASRRLRRTVRDIDVVARSEEDGFLVLLRDLVGRQDIMAITNRITQVLSRDFRIHSGTTAVRTSMGIAVGSPDQNPVDLVIQATTALRRARVADGGTVFHDVPDSPTSALGSQLSGPGLGSEVPPIPRPGLAEELRSLLATGDVAQRLAFEYKPIVRLADGVAPLVESIVSWDPSFSNSLPHDALLRLAEDNGLATPLSDQLIAAAAAQSAAWSSQGLSLTVVVKISVQCLGDPGFASTVQETIEHSGCSADLLGIALTEEEISANADIALTAFDELQHLGVRRVITSYGVMPDSLPQLRRMHVTEVILDNTLSNIETASSTQQAIVINIIEMSHIMGFTVIASRVRSASALAFLRRAGCEYAKGPVICGPVPADQIADALSRAQRETLTAITQASTS